MNNAAIARAFGEVVDLLEIEGANPFRIRAYRNAERTVEAATEPLARMLAAGRDLTELPGIGKEMAGHVAELVESGTLSVRDALLAKTPRGLLDLMRLPGVGPKKARKLWQELAVSTVDELEREALAGRVAGIEGFGEKSQEKILAGIAEHRQHQGRRKLADADEVSERLVAWMEGVPELARIAVAGSWRRRRETIGDLDLLAVAHEHPEQVGAAAQALMARFLAYPAADRVLGAGDTKSSIVLGDGLQVDLRVVPAESWGAALVYFTGGKEHNIRLRRRGVERGLKISEYGVFRVEDAKPEENADPRAGDRVAGATEEEVYAAVGLAWVPPELREDRGEIEAAARGPLPRLLELGDFRGDLHMHSTWSDGRASIEEMVAACAARGYAYLALADHSPALAMTGGLDAARLREQWREIAEVQARHPEIRILRSQEVDILADGRLDLDDESLGLLDLAVVSIHSRFELAPAAQTERILKALAHPKVDILAHPTGRLINRRKPIDFDLDAVLEACAELGVAVECNAHPDRLDLKDTHLARARELGVPVVISTDAHSVRDLDLMRFGLDQARRAALEPRHVLNTRPLEELLKGLRRHR